MASRATLREFDGDGIIFRDVGRFTEEVVRLGIPAVAVGHRGREVRGLINVVTDSERIGQSNVLTGIYSGVAKSILPIRPRP